MTDKRWSMTDRPDVADIIRAPRTPYQQEYAMAAHMEAHEMLAEDAATRGMEEGMTDKTEVERRDLIGFYALQRPEQADREIANDVLEHAMEEKRMLHFRDLVLIATRARQTAVLASPAPRMVGEDERVSGATARGVVSQWAGGIVVPFAGHLSVGSTALEELVHAAWLARAAPSHPAPDDREEAIERMAEAMWAQDSGNAPWSELADVGDVRDGSLFKEDYRRLARTGYAALATPAPDDREAIRREAVEEAARVAENRMPVVQCMSVADVVDACVDIARAIRALASTDQVQP